MIKLAIFDVDGTLFSAEHAAFKIENEIAGSMGFSPMTRESHLKNWGLPLREAIVERVPGIDEDLFVKNYENVICKFIEKGEWDALESDVLDVLKILKKNGIKLAILSARTEGEMKHLMHEDHPFSGIMEAFYHKDNLEFCKPDPRAFKHALERFEVKPEEAVYVGDSVNDGICAKAAGLSFIALLQSGILVRSDFASVPVDFFADNINDILKFFKARGLLDN